MVSISTNSLQLFEDFNLHIKKIGTKFEDATHTIDFLILSSIDDNNSQDQLFKMQKKYYDFLVKKIIFINNKEFKRKQMKLVNSLLEDLRRSTNINDISFIKEFITSILEEEIKHSIVKKYSSCFLFLEEYVNEQKSLIQEEKIQIQSRNSNTYQPNTTSYFSNTNYDSNTNFNTTKNGF